MKSIGARLALWYALASTATLACLFLAGRYFLEQHAINALDLLNASEFEQVKSRLGPDYSTLTPETIRDRLSDAVIKDSVLYYIEIHQAGPGVLYQSNNLQGHSIPDVPGERYYNAPVDGLGEVRAGEFLLGPFDVLIATSKRQIREIMRGYEKNFYGLLVLMFAGSSVIGYAISRAALRPLRLIQETATHISSDNLSERIPVPPVQDEVSDLARLLNQMFDRLEAAFNQTRRFTAEASHELKTPLSLVRLLAENLLLAGDLKPQQEEVAQEILEEIARLNQMIEELLFLSRAEAHAITLQARALEPRKFIEAFAADARVLAEAQGVHFVEHISGDGEAVFDAKWIRQVLLNLLSNALRVSPRDSRIRLESELAAGMWRVAVEDEGPGVPVTQREKIFERFVRLEADGKIGDQGGGSGLGLTISRSIVGLHRGVIRAESTKSGSGLRVVFELPTERPAEEGAIKSPAVVSSRPAARPAPV